MELGLGQVRFAQGVKAGRWVFATGVMAQDFAGGIAPDVLAERAPHAGVPKREKEAARIFANLDAVLQAGGTERGNLVRTDQYYTTVKAVPPYQAVRREVLGGRIPPSTSIAQKGLLLPGADMNIQAIAVIPQQGFAPEHLKHEHLKGRPTSGYSPALTVGDFVFIPGCTAIAIGDEPRRNGMAAAALMAEGMQWGGQPIKLEAEFIITQRIAPSLQLAGARLEDVVHAQVYLTEPDYAAFNEAWLRHFGSSGPAFSIIPCIEHGLAPYHGNIEINVMAVKSGGATKTRRIDAGVVTGFRNQPQAVRAGDLLCISGLMAIDQDGLGCCCGARSAATLVLVIRGSPGGLHHRQRRETLRSRRHVARQRRARSAVSYRHRRILSGLQSVGAPPGRAARSVFRRRGPCAAAGARRDRHDRGLGVCSVNGCCAEQARGKKISAAGHGSVGDIDRARARLIASPTKIMRPAQRGPAVTSPMTTNPGAIKPIASAHNAAPSVANGKSQSSSWTPRSV